MDPEVRFKPDFECEILSEVATGLIDMGEVGSEIPSSSTLFSSDRKFEYSNALHLLKIVHQGPFKNDMIQP